MFVPLEQARWPAPGEVRDLRISLNAPVLLGPETGSHPTRAALGWTPRPDQRAVVRLWLHSEPGAGDAAVRAFDLAERPIGPAARATAIEGAERFLAGFGFLFGEGTEGLAATGGSALTGEFTHGVDPRAELLRTSVLDPIGKPGATASAVDVSIAVRADVRLTKLRQRGPRGPVGESNDTSSRGVLDRLFRSGGLRTGGTEA